MILRALRLSFLLLSFTTPLPGQAASYTNFGQGCGFGTIQPQARAEGDPKLGGTCSVYAWFPSWFRYRTFSQTVLVTGLSNTTWAGGALPFPIPPLDPYLYGTPRCSLLVSPDLVMGFSSTGAHVPFDIPNDARLIGLTLYQQWMHWVFEGAPTCACFYFLTSNGGAMRIGI